MCDSTTSEYDEFNSPLDDLDIGPETLSSMGEDVAGARRPAGDLGIPLGAVIPTSTVRAVTRS